MSKVRDLKLIKFDVDTQARSFPLALLKRDFEIKKLSDGYTLVLFDAEKKKPKVPLLLILKAQQYYFDARTFISTPFLYALDIQDGYVTPEYTNLPNEFFLRTYVCEKYSFFKKI